jgi:3'(2'), 5'-bisphosphate nucleotidase
VLNRPAIEGGVRPPKVAFVLEETSVSVIDIAECLALMDDLTEISALAAQAIKNWSGKGTVRSKADGSPVTAADEAAEAVICDGLARLAPAMPVISEEQASRNMPKMPVASPGSVAASYFLVDPLDGTREFIAGRDEYTVNIALVSAGLPVLGIITAPAVGLTWRGIVGRGAERIVHTDRKNSPPHAIRTRPRPERGLVVLLSRSHLDERTRAYRDALPHAKSAQCGSSIKFCRIAEGAADLYPRLAPTRDWDIAAGHAILKAAGGDVTAPDGSPLRYGSQDLLIPAFLASGVAITA